MRFRAADPCSPGLPCCLVPATPKVWAATISSLHAPVTAQVGKGGPSLTGVICDFELGPMVVGKSLF